MMSAVFAMTVGLLSQVQAMEGQMYKLVQTLAWPDGHKLEVTAVAITPDGQKMVTGSNDHEVKVWEFQDDGWVCIVTFSWSDGLEDAHGDRISSVAITPDGQTIVSGSYDNTAKIWELQNNEWVYAATLENESVVLSVAITPDRKKIVMGLRECEAKVWEFDGNQWMSMFMLDGEDGHKEGIISVATTADGQTIVTASWDNTAKVWMFQGDQWICVRTFNMQDGQWIGSITITPDGQTALIGLASLDGSFAYLYKFQSNTFVYDAVLKEQDGFKIAISSVAITPDGQKVVTGSLDGAANVWGLQDSNWTCVAKLIDQNGISNNVTSVGITSDGKTIITGSKDGTVKVWQRNLSNRVKSAHFEGRIEYEEKEALRELDT